MTHPSEANESASTDTPAAVLDVSGLAFGYARHQPLMESLSARLLPGRVCVLLGPNAAGKSTLLKLLLGELTPWQGQITLMGRPVHRLGAGERAALISYVPQRGDASFSFTVRQVVEMGRFALTRDPLAIEQAMASCDLAGLEDRIYSQLSVGQQQRVLLARAMAQSHGQGRVMLLDEPGSAMDLRHVHQMMQTLTQLAQSGLAVLVVVHDLNVAARYADDIWLMDQGKMVACGPWQTILEPEVLSPVYQMRLTKLTLENHDRPVFAADAFGLA